jgi:ABC-2 type transport system permease protein
MRELLLAANLRAQGFLASVSDLSLRGLLKSISSIVIFGGVAVGVFFLSRGTTEYLLEQAHIGPFLYHRFLSMLLYVFFITVNVGNMIVCYATLYRSDEVRFLMALPLAHEKIFLLKFVDNFFYSSSTLTLLGMAWLFGYGSFYHMPWHFYLFAAAAVLIPFMLIAGLAAVTTLMVLIRAAARIGVRWLLGLIVAVYAVAVYAYFRITNPVQMVKNVMQHYPNVNEYFGYLDAPFVRFLPNHWVSEYLYWSVLGDGVRAFPYLFMLLITLAALVLLAWQMARRLYYDSWVSAADALAARGERRQRRSLRFLELGGPAILRGPADVFARRDLWMFLREPSQWLHLGMMVVLLAMFVMSVSSLEMKTSQALLQAVTFIVVFLFNGFLVASITLRFVFPAVSMEGDAFWAVRSAPVSLTKLYWGKLLAALAGVVFVAELLALLSIGLIRDSAPLLALSSVSAASVALALTSLNLGAGAAFAVYREKNPIRIASTQGASLTFLLSMMYLAFVVAVLVLPLHAHFEALHRGEDASGTWILVPLAVIVAGSLAVFALSTNVGLRAIRRDA